MNNSFRLAPTPAHATDPEISGLFKLLTCPKCGDGHPFDRPCTLFRQRFECTCGNKETRDFDQPSSIPSHIRCPNCAGVAVAIGRAERLS